MAVLYGPASTSDFRGANGTCSEPRASKLAVVSAQHGSAGIVGNVAPIEPQCSVNAIAVTRHGWAAVEQCDDRSRLPYNSLYIAGPTRLVRYSPSLNIVARAALGRCQDGASMAGQPASDEVVISTYLYCGGQNHSQPVTWVFVATGNQPQQLLVLPGPQLSIGFMST